MIAWDPPASVREALERLVRAAAGRPLLTAALVVVTVAGGVLWLRDSSLVEVREVTVTGIDGRSGPAIRSALRDAADDMTTLHVREDELRRVVAPYPMIRDLRVSRDLPNRLRIEVVTHDAVAYARLRGRRVPVAADGTLLREEPAMSGLPRVPSGRRPDPDRLTDRRALAAVRVAAAAPEWLRPLIDEVRSDRAGLHAVLRSGPQLDFGAPGDLRAKWLAAASVLVEPRAAGASYVDLRVPARPVAGPFAQEPMAVEGQELGQESIAPEPAVSGADPSAPAGAESTEEAPPGGG